MIEALSDAKSSNFWFGIGIDVESQGFAVGISQMMATMWSYANPATSCVISVFGYQFGPGLGGKGDIVLVLGTGISGPDSFRNAALDGGWNPAVATDVDWSVVKSGKAVADVAKLLRTVPPREILKFGVKHPPYLGSLYDVAKDFYNSLMVGGDTLFRVPRLWMFPLAGGGLELSLTYRCNNRTELVSK
jgi:hypothetical protein